MNLTLAPTRASADPGAGPACPGRPRESTVPPLWTALVPLGSATASVRVVAAEGHRVSFADGRTLLCATSGLWNVNLGYGNRHIAARVHEAMLDCSYAGVFRYENALAREAAVQLLDLAGGRFATVIFSVSGGSANDLVMKLARHHQALGGQPQRTIVVGLQGSYHGLTYGAHALSGDDLAQSLYHVERAVAHVPPNDEIALRRLVQAAGRRIAAFVVEPVLGSGAVALHPAYLRLLGELARDCGALLVADEVATGFARTGPMFASAGWPVAPDVLVCSKALTNGTMPASAVLVAEPVAARFADSGSVLVHAETQAGTAVTAAAALATFEEMRRVDVTSAAHRVSGWLDEHLAGVLTRADVSGCAGVGCLRAITVTGDDDRPMTAGQVPHLVAAVRDAGAIVHPGPHGVQVLPALTYSRAEVSELFRALTTGLDTWAARSRA